MFALYNVGRALKLTGNMKKYKLNNTYTEKETFINEITFTIN